MMRASASISIGQRRWALTVVILLISWVTGCASGPSLPSPTATEPTHTYSLKPQPNPYVRETPLNYQLYLPQTYTPDREWPLFVGLHGAGGSAWDCLNVWQAYADQEGFVLLCPSLQDQPQGSWDHDEKKVVLNEVIAAIQQECHLKPRVFVAGFSRGGHLAQRFAWAYPEVVGAVAVLSAVQYDPPEAQANAVPFLVILGKGDHQGGVEQVQGFVEALRQAEFSVDLHLLPGVGHTLTDEARTLTLDFFRQTVGKSDSP